MSDDLNDGVTDGGALRAQYEKALKDLKAAQEQNATLSTQLRQTSVKDLFGELKADPRGVKFYTGEPTKEALTEWLKGDGDPFATAPAAPAVVTPGTVVPAAPGAVVPAVQLPPGITPEMLAAAQTAAALQPQTPSAPTGDLGALTSGLTGLDFSTPEAGQKIADVFQVIRAQSAAALAAGGSL